jgi:CDP-diacylglycerol---glycerol-3-phosphate 3-phosphatidyltransferase
VGWPRFNLANQVTILRFLFALACFAALYLLEECRVGGTAAAVSAWVAGVLFAAGTALDALDGYLARRYGTITVFGRIADPFVDKIIVCGALIFLCAIPQTRPYLHPWMVVVIIVREFLVTGIRGYMESVGVAFGAELPGKIKMFVQSLCIVLLILTIAVDGGRFVLVRAANHAFVWATLAFTVWSATSYVVKAAGRLGVRDI